MDVIGFQRRSDKGIQSILVMTFSAALACSSSNGEKGTLPDVDDGDAKPGMKLTVPDSQCFVGDSFVVFYVSILTTFEYSRGENRTERLLWSIACTEPDNPRCTGTLLHVGSIESTQEVTIGDQWNVSGEVLSIDGLKAMVEIEGGTFHVDAAAGRVTYEGTALRVGPRRGYGEATCKYHGAPHVTTVPRP